MKQLPTTIKGLLDELDTDYPHKCPKPDDTEREIWMKVGARQLVDNLLRRASGKTNDLNQKGNYYHVHLR